MAAEGHAPTSGEYIVHHLTHLQSEKQTALVDFSVFNLDSIFFSVVLGVITCWAFWPPLPWLSPSYGPMGCSR